MLSVSHVNIWLVLRVWLQKKLKVYEVAIVNGGLPA